MLSPKQIGTICFAIFSILISAPLFATGISSGASSAGCDNSTLSTYSGTSNLQAGWQANTIALHWYNGDTEITSGVQTSCVYDGALTPPTTIPTKTGYTFKGWRVKQASSGGQQVEQCVLSHVDTSIYADWDADYVAWQPTSGSSGYTVAQAIDGGDIDPGTDHSSELSNGEWRIIFSYGTVKGMAKCSNTNGDYATVGNPSNTNGQYCWCAATSYAPDGGNQCNIASPSWVFCLDGGFAYFCADRCAYWCASYVDYNEDFLRVVFGVQ